MAWHCQTWRKKHAGEESCKAGEKKEGWGNLVCAKVITLGRSPFSAVHDASLQAKRTLQGFHLTASLVRSHGHWYISFLPHSRPTTTKTIDMKDKHSQHAGMRGRGSACPCHMEPHHKQVAPFSSWRAFPWPVWWTCAYISINECNWLSVYHPRVVFRSCAPCP
jgi:hypothetical protein